MQLFNLYIKRIWRDRKTLIALVFIFGLIFINFIKNLSDAYSAHYIEAIYGVTNMSLLSANSYFGAYFIVLFPILVVLPTSTLYLTDRETRAGVAVKIRSSKVKYIVSMFAAVFVSTFLIFSVPFILEMLMEIIAFGVKANGNVGYATYFDLLDTEYTFFAFDLFVKSRVLYSLMYSLLIGLLAAVFAVFNFSLTTLPFFKYKVLTFFPIYIILYVLEYVRIVRDDAQVRLLNYTDLRIFDSKEINIIAWGCVAAVLFIISLIMAVRKICSDEE